MDISYLLFLQNLREVTGGIFNQFLLFITHFGEDPYLFTILALIYWCFHKKLGQKLWLTIGTAHMLNGLFKLLACVYRPWIRDARIEPLDGAKTTATGYSFPSGHSTNASSVFGTLAYENRKRKSLFWCLVLMVLLVMLSRNYLGVHTPQDVLVGCLTGVVVMLFMNRLLQWETEKSGRDTRIVFGGIGMVLVILLIVFTKSYPVDYDAAGAVLVDYKVMRIDTLKSAGTLIGLLLGWLFEKRYVAFENPDSLQDKMAVFLPGILVMGLLFYVLEAILVLVCGKAVGYIISRFIVAFYIMGGYPWYFYRKTAKA